MLCPPPGGHPNPGTEPASSTAQVDSLSLNHWGKPPVSSSVQFSCSVVCHSLRESGGDKGSPFVSREVSKKPLAQPVVTTSPRQGAYPSCLYTEIVECTFPFWFGKDRSPLFSKGNTTQACSNSPGSEPERQPMEPIMHWVSVLIKNDLLEMKQLKTGRSMFLLGWFLKVHLLDLETVIQREVSEKEKSKYLLLPHIRGI